MKLAKTKLLLGLLLGVTIVTSSVAPFLSVPKAAAAPTFINGKGQTDVPSEGRFIFLSPMQIEDTTTNTYYYVKSTACNQDGLFSCGSSNPGGYADTFREENQDKGHGDSYWYWPTSDGKWVNTPVNNLCKSALVLGIPISGKAAVGERIQAVHLSVVNPTPVAGGKCVVQDGDGRNVPEQDVEGYGIAAGKFAWVQNYNSANDGYRSNNTDYCEDTADTVDSHCLVKSSQVAVTDLTSRNGSAQDQQTLLGLGTIFHWSGKTQLTSYLDDNYSSSPVTDQASITDIVNGLKKGANSNTKSLADPSKYDYYSNSRCISNNSYKAAIVVAKTDPYHATIVSKPKGDTTKGFTDQWTAHDESNGNDDEPSVWADCLYSADDLARSIPSEVWMDPNHQTYTAYIGLADTLQVKLGSGAPTAGGSQGSGSADGTGSSPAINCSVTLFNPLSWFLCPLATALEAVVTELDNEINIYLDISPAKQNAYSTDCSGLKGSESQWCGAYNAWSVVRNVSLGLIAVFALVAIVSQAMGFEIFDAYTVRKILPRLLVAAIGITLSWPLMMWFIQFTDDVGVGIRQLIYAPFSHYAVQLGGGGQFVIGFFGGGAFIVALGFAGLLSFVATAALAVALAFLVLTLRQMLIVMLVIFAPIAIACYVLPNTQKGWKLWSDSFGKALMMFPLIAAFIAIGRVFAAVNSTNAGSINQVIAFTAYFAPYFLIPFTFRLAGGALGSLAGVVNDRGRGVFDRLKKQRQGIMSDRFQKAQNNTLWDTNSGIGKVGNKLASWATDPLNNAAYYGRNTVPGLRKRGLKIADHLGAQGLEQSAKLAEEFKGFNDRGLRALTGVHSGMSDDVQAELKRRGMYGTAPKSLSDLQSMAEVLREHGNGAEINAANAIEGSMGRLATLYQDPEMGRANIAAAGAMALAQHGFLAPKDMPELGNILQDQMGTATAQSVLSQAALMGQRSRPDLKNGYGWMYDRASGKFVDGIHDGGTGGPRDLALVASTNSHDVASAKGGYMDDMKDTYQEILVTSRTNAAYKAASDKKRALGKDQFNAQATAEEKRFAQAYDMHDATLNQVLSWTSPFTQASADVSTAARGWIDDFGLQSEKARYDQMESARSQGSRGGASAGGDGGDGGAGGSGGGGGAGGGGS